MEFKAFNKIPRLSREMVITEKIDGTNGIIAISEDGDFYVGSRNQWICGYKAQENREFHNANNYGFGVWALSHREELMGLGVGYHYGEWWGAGIQRGYDLKEKRFSLFNAERWSDDTVRPACCHVVPVLFRGTFDTAAIEDVLQHLKTEGSKASPGYMHPEGIVVYHEASRALFKKTIEKDASPKSLP